jgi:hypothetical protein
MGRTGSELSAGPSLWDARRLAIRISLRGPEFQVQLVDELDDPLTSSDFISSHTAHCRNRRPDAACRENAARRAHQKPRGGGLIMYPPRGSLSPAMAVAALMLRKRTLPADSG